MLSIREPTGDEIRSVKEKLENGMDIEDDREIWIWREYLE